MTCCFLYIDVLYEFTQYFYEVESIIILILHSGYTVLLYSQS